MRKVLGMACGVVFLVSFGVSPASALTQTTVAGCPTSVYVVPQDTVKLAFGTDAGTQAAGPCNAAHSYVAVAAFLYALPLNATPGGQGERVGDGGVLVASSFGFCHQGGGCTGAQTDTASALLPPGIYQVTGYVGVWDSGSPSTTPATASGYVVDQRFLYNGFTASPI